LSPLPSWTFTFFSWTLFFCHHLSPPVSTLSPLWLRIAPENLGLFIFGALLLQFAPKWSQFCSKKTWKKSWTYQKFRKAFEGNKIFRKRKLIKAKCKSIIGIHTMMLQNISALLPHLRQQTA